MYQLRETDVFSKWLSDLRDMRAKASEIRVDVGAGYRVYFTRRQRVMLILLCGGDKSSQARDIARAQRLAQAID